MKNKVLISFGLIFCLGLICASLVFYEKPAFSAGDDFTLIWSSDSYIPTDYLGKALPTKNSNITVWAMPTKKLSANPDFLIYRWFLDENIMGWAGGKGKSTFKFTADKWGGQTHQVEVQILNSSEEPIFSRIISIQVVDPQVILKTKEGEIVNRTYSIQNGKTLSLIAQPLFFNIKAISQALFEWKVDDIKLNAGQSEQNKLELTIPKTEISSSLFKLINLTTSNPKDEFERSSRDLNLEIN